MLRCLRVSCTGRSMSSPSRQGDRPTVPESAIQSGAERVFVTHPRLFSFSSRPLASLRHPYLPIALAQAETDLAKVKRQFQTKGERLADILTPTSNTFKFEEERWCNVGFMLDTILFEAQIAARREALIDSPATVRAAETVWAKCGCSHERGMTFDLYNAMHQFLYERLLGVSDPALATIISQAIEADWSTDRRDRQELDFGDFFLSFLEVTDNWIPVRDPEAYASFLSQALESFSPPPTTSSGELDSPAMMKLAQPSATTSSEDWDAVVSSIRQHAQCLQRMPVIRARRSVTGAVVFERTDPPSQTQTV